MNRPLKLPWLMILLRLALGGVFLLAGMSKMQRPYAFLIAVYQYQLISQTLSKAIVGLLPSLELLLGACLLGGVALRGCLLWCAILSACFAAAKLWALIRGLPIACGCFGTVATLSRSTTEVSYASAIANVVTLLAAWIGLRVTTRAWEDRRTSSSPSSLLARRSVAQ